MGKYVGCEGMGLKCVGKLCALRFLLPLHHSLHPPIPQRQHHRHRQRPRQHQRQHRHRHRHQRTHPHRHPTPPPTANTFVVVSTQGRTSRQSPCETLTMPAKRKSVAERRAKAPCTDVVDAVAFAPLRSMSDMRTLFKNTAEPTDVKAEIEGEAVSVVNDDGHDAHVGAAASGSLPKEEARCPIVATGDVLAKPALATPSPSTLPPTDLEECLDAYVEDACGIRVTAEDMREFETRLASARTIADSEAARQDPKLSELEELAVTGVFDIRDKVGQTWSRLVTKDAQLSKDYAACVAGVQEELPRGVGEEGVLASVG